MTVRDEITALFRDVPVKAIRHDIALGTHVLLRAGTRHARRAVTAAVRAAAGRPTKAAPAPSAGPDAKDTLATPPTADTTAAAAPAGKQTPAAPGKKATPKADVGEAIGLAVLTLGAVAAAAGGILGPLEHRLASYTTARHVLDAAVLLAVAWSVAARFAARHHPDYKPRRPTPAPAAGTATPQPPAQAPEPTHEHDHEAPPGQLEEAPPEPPNSPSRETLTRALHHLYQGGSGVLHTALVQHLGLADSQAAKRALGEAGIPYRAGVRTPAGNGPGTHRSDFPPLPPTPGPPQGTDVGAGQAANTNTNNAANTPREGFGVSATEWTPDEAAQGYRWVQDLTRSCAWKIQRHPDSLRPDAHEQTASHQEGDLA